MWPAALPGVVLGLLGSMPVGGVFTVAGAESAAMEACSAGERCPAATQQLLTGHCLASFADGTIVLCKGRMLLTVGRDGRVRPWTDAAVGKGFDADTAPDGSVMVVGAEGVARIGASGSAHVLVR